MRKGFRDLLVRLALAAVAAAALSACSDSSSSSGGSNAGSWAAVSYASHFSTTKSNAYLNSAEFKNVEAACTYKDCASSGALGGTQPNAYELLKVHVAHGAGLSGAGQLVAVVDEGFHLTHNEFAGKTIYKYGTISDSDHGTHVASLIAGRKDNSGIYGVAYGAALHLTDFDDDIVAGTLDAAARKAVAQNNSWGFVDSGGNEVSASTLKGYLDSHPGASAAQGLSYVLTGSTADASGYQSYFDALNTFQNNGVVVFANSNDEGLDNASVMAAIPHFYSSLAEAWIVAVNGYYEVNASGDITYAHLISAPCGYAASFCLAGDGTTVAASSSADNAYASGSGTSYVAPQISGSIALLAEAFPGLSPSELTDRLLASADNSWFAKAGAGVDGTTDFGNGVTHGYSDEWGHGTVDLEAALQPIGGLSVKSANSVYTSTGSTPLSTASVTTSAAFGDGIVHALSGREMAVFDALNAGFEVEAGSLFAPQSVGLTRNLMASVATSRSGNRFGLATPDTPPLASFSQEIADGLESRFAVTGNLALAEAPDPAAINAQRTSVLGFAQTAATATVTRDLGVGELSVFGFTADHSGVADAALTGVGAKMAFEAGAGKVSVGVRQMAESGAFLGLTGSDAFDFGPGSALTTIDLGFSQKLSDRLTLFGGGEYGVAGTGGAGSSGLVDDISLTGFSGFETGLTLADVTRPGDSLTFSIAQPLRVESGRTELSLPVGRTADGTITYETVDANLAPTGREIDLSMAYALPVGAGTAKVGLTYAHDLGHVSGARGYGIAASFGSRF